MSVPKKHHYVPQFLLRNFADEREQLVVHRTDQQRQYVASARDLGHRNSGHSLFWPDREPDHVSLETRMSDIEGVAADVVAQLRNGRTRSVTPAQREVLGFLIALQWARSRFLLMVLHRDVLGRDTPVDDTNRSLGLINIFISVLNPWEARQQDVFDPKDRYCSIEGMLANWNWRIYRPTEPKLVVADNVVSMWGVAAGHVSPMPEAWTRHGVGVAFGTCARITMPLAPELGLVLTPKTQTPGKITATEFNRATIYNSREFVAHHPAGLPNQHLRWAFADDIQTQRWILPTILAGTTSRTADTPAEEI